jgi:ATP-dependent DNA ligase
VDLRTQVGWFFGFSQIIRDGAVRLISRNGHPCTNLFGPVSDALRGFPVSILLDGEVIAINDKSQPDFEALQARLRIDSVSDSKLGFSAAC